MTILFTGFKEKQKLARHTLVHTGEKSHVCHICSRAFSLKHNLKSHLKIHDGRGTFCRYCGKMFTQSKNLTMHESTHANKGHRMTQDKDVQDKQKLKDTGKGRKSLMEMDKMRKKGGAKQGAETIKKRTTGRKRRVL